ncbi:MAG: potassium channel family protein [Patescibacteria group bacterium]
MAKLDARDYSTLFIVWLINAVVFAGIYWFLDRVPDHGLIEPLLGTDAPVQWYDALYFSVVTGTTVGYGDFIPTGASRAFAALQSLISFVLLAATVSVFAGARTEHLIRDVHKLQREVHAHVMKRD